MTSTSPESDWSGDDAPKPAGADRGWHEILPAGALQDAVFALVKAAVDRTAAEGSTS